MDLLSIETCMYLNIFVIRIVMMELKLVHLKYINFNVILK